MKDNFRGWTSVYAFTLSQATKGVSFKLVTILVSLLIAGALVVVNLVVAKPDKDNKSEPSPIKIVYVLDNSGLQPTNYKDIISQTNKNDFNKTEYMNVIDKSSEEVVKAAGEKSSEAIAVVITKKDLGYELKALIPESSKISKSEAESLLNSMSSAFETNKLMQVGLSSEQLIGVLKPTVVSFSQFGESSSEVTKIIKVVAPMVFSFVMYFMLLLYATTLWSDR
ncbi:hypothetical protein SDC9_152354 [bioreactor metagenome]|uniref:Uncharacterized protein n=1 Tax=bioreactor metagenome TaxID=1076179 RepID=A0A645EXD7_9ZZZZ